MDEPETLSVTLRENCVVKMSENRVLKRICAHKREEVTEGLRKLYIGELYTLYSSLNIIKMPPSSRYKSNSSALKIVGSSKTMAPIYQTAQHHITEY